MSNRTDELKRQIANARAPRRNHDINILGARLSERELAEEEFEKEYGIMLSNYCKVLDLITNGKMSKPNYTWEAISEIIEEERVKYQETIREDERKEFKEWLERTYATKSLFDMAVKLKDKIGELEDSRPQTFGSKESSGLGGQV